MSPAKSRKAKASVRKAGKPRKAAKAGKAKPRRAAPARRAAARPAKPAGPAQGGDGHAHCAASDPFGDPCQNLPRRPSKYCVIHSYLER